MHSGEISTNMHELKGKRQMMQWIGASCKGQDRSKTKSWCSNEIHPSHTRGFIPSRFNTISIHVLSLSVYMYTTVWCTSHSRKSSASAWSRHNAVSEESSCSLHTPTFHKCVIEISLFHLSNHLAEGVSLSLYLISIYVYQYILSRLHRGLESSVFKY